MAADDDSMSNKNLSIARRLFRFFETNFEKLLAVLFLVSMVSLLTAIVFFRFVLNRGLSFAVELERMAFIWFVYTGAAYAARERRHIRVEAPLLLMKEKTRKILRLIADVIWVLFNGVIVREGIRLVHSMVVYPYESPALGISMAYAYSIVPLSFTLISIRVLQNLVKDFKAIISRDG